MAISEFGGKSGPIRQTGLVEQVIAAAFQTFDGAEIHPVAFEKAAMLMRGIIQGHPLTDGNRRTGFLTATYDLSRIGYVPRPNLPQAEVISVCRQVSAREIRDLATMAAALRAWTESTGAGSV